jgi:flavodoxin I
MAIGLFYGTDTGNTERVAQQIADAFGGGVDLHDVAVANAGAFAGYSHIILGQPTWYYGELQSHWEDFWEQFQQIDFTGKTVALFGLGDQHDYSEYFLDAIGMMNNVVLEKGGKVVGHWSTDGYEFDESKALTPDGKCFVGLGIDEDQQAELTAGRIQKWVAQVKAEFGV